VGCSWWTVISILPHCGPVFSANFAALLRDLGGQSS
jgi:hypothetical protein